MTTLNNKIRLKGLDGLRCIGSFIILFYHLERSKEVSGMEPSVIHRYTGLGQSIMTLFFVLSGFLIFYILFKEKSETQTVSVKQFYKKRIARIWPVYYIIIFASLLFFERSDWFIKPDVFKHTHDYPFVLAVYFLHIPNLNGFFSSALIAAGHLWSLGVEEQFYAIAPWLIKKTKKYLKVFLIIIFLKIFLKLVFALSYRVMVMPHDTYIFIKHIERFLYKLRFEAFAMGGISAYLLIEQKNRALMFIYRPSVQILNIIVLVLTIPLGTVSESIQILFSLSFSILILNIVGNDRTVFMPDFKITNYIGKISYGMYMYQIPVCYIIINFLKPYYDTVDHKLWHIIYYLSSTILTIAVSSASYEFMEKKINRWAHQK